MGQEDIERIAALIRRVAQGRTVVMVEHNLNVVASLCEVITVLTRGKVLAEGDYASVSSDAAVQQAYLGEQEASHV
jgi:branched-chain amino acid transport system ATP-binding protein